VYDKDEVSVKTHTILKDETFFVIGEPAYYNKSFYEIDNFYGVKGLVLHKTSFTELKDKWISMVGIIVAILTVGGIFLAFLNAGWIVVSALFLIPAFIAAIIVIIALQIVTSIIAGIVHLIRIRL
jgi:hypothetical protein